MTIGYVNHPDDFAANENHLDRLLNGISISDPNLDDRAEAALAWGADHVLSTADTTPFPNRS